MKTARRLPSVLLAGLAGMLLAVAARVPGQDASRRDARDVTFVLSSDIHVGADDPKAVPPVTPDRILAEARARLDAMRSWPGKRYPARAGFAGFRPDAADVPRGIFLLGDLTDGHKDPARQREQWAGFEALFPLDGIPFGSRRVPIYALAGNHDGPLDGPQRRGLAARNRALLEAGRLDAISDGGAHFAVRWDGVHLLGLGLCPADATDSETPFKYGQPGPGSWNDPDGALSFLRDYLTRAVGASGEPVVILQHYGFDEFSENDWNWWTPKQRRALYELLAGYDIAAIAHGHDHQAEHYVWPDPRRHAADLEAFFGGAPPAGFRRYDILSCGGVGWLVRIRGARLAAVRFTGPDWPADPAAYFEKKLK